MKSLFFNTHSVWENIKNSQLIVELGHQKVAQIVFMCIKGTVIKSITDSLYQRHYKSWSLYIFVFLYYHKGYDNACLGEGRGGGGV